MNSLPGGDNQDLHTDYSLDDIARSQQHYPSSLPTRVIVLVMERTLVRVLKGCTNELDEREEEIVELQPVWCIIFRGDLTHSCVSYLELNYRIHCYLALKDDKNWVPGQVIRVVGSNVTCDYCKKELAPRRIGKNRYDSRMNPGSSRAASKAQASR